MPVEFLTIGREKPAPSVAVEHMVRMRDGVRLATDVYLPDGWSAGPTVLVRLPYDKGSRYVFFAYTAPLFLARGYAMVVQDVRGKYGSEGDTVAFINEVDDGYDTIEWIVNQPWSDGAVGMFGDSYYGFTQWAAVASKHPALRAIVPRVTSANLPGHERAARRAGRPRRVVPLWQPLYMSQVWVDNESYDFVPDMSLRPIKAIFDDVFDSLGKRSAYYDLSVPHPAPVRTFTDGHPFDGRPLPVLHVAGWFDNLKDVSMDDYLTLVADPRWEPLQYLWVDSTDHEGYRLPDTPITEAEDHGVNDAALARHLARYVDPAADFFDVFLSGRRPASTLPKVQYHHGNADMDVLETAQTWPPPGVGTTTLYPQASTDPAGSGGALSAAAPKAGTVSWKHDPDDLVPSNVANLFAMLFEYPDETPTSEHRDVVTFTTDEFGSDLDLLGGARLRVTVSSSAPTTDLIVKLTDVSPDGTSRLVLWGDAQVDTDAGPAEVTIDLGHTAYRLRATHRLRLQIQSSDFPTYLPNPGTAADPWTATQTSPSEQTLLTGAGVTELSLTVRPG